MTTIETTGLLNSGSQPSKTYPQSHALSFWKRLADFAVARDRARRHRRTQAQLAALDERLLNDIGDQYLEKRARRAPRYRPLAAPVLHIHAE